MIHLPERSLLAYREGDLPAAQRTVIAGHLQLCECCAESLRRLAEHEALIAAARPATDPLSPDAAEALFRRALADAKRRSLVRWRLAHPAWATAALLIAAAGVQGAHERQRAQGNAAEQIVEAPATNVGVGDRSPVLALGPSPARTGVTMLVTGRVPTVRVGVAGDGSPLTMRDRILPSPAEPRAAERTRVGDAGKGPGVRTETRGATRAFHHRRHHAFPGRVRSRWLLAGGTRRVSPAAPPDTQRPGSGVMFVSVSDPEQLSVQVGEAPASTRGYACAAALRSDNTGNLTWARATVGTPGGVEGPGSTGSELILQPVDNGTD
jgi:hypothetical protein